MQAYLSTNPIWNLIINLHNDPKALDLLRYQVAGPPYLVKKQGILKNRLVLLTNVLELIATLDPNQITAIRDYHNGKWKVKDTRVLLEPNQKSTPSLETALTRGEYEIFVKQMREQQPPPKENPDMIAANLEVYRDQYGLNKARIRDQLEKDLVRTQVIMNGCRYVNFEPLHKDVLAAMKGNEEATWTYLCLLQQGSNADVLIDLNKSAHISEGRNTGDWKTGFKCSKSNLLFDGLLQDKTQCCLQLKDDAQTF